MSMDTQLHISEAQKQQYREEGYFIIENALSGEQLELLRQECDLAVQSIDAEMEGQGVEVQGLNRRGSRYFISHLSRSRPALREVLYGDVMAQICQATIGDTAYALWEQFVVKGADTGMKFSWHQDAAYAYSSGAIDIPPAVSCWCALEDMSEQNGTVYLLPFSRAGGRLIEHVLDEEINDLVGYFGDDPGVPVIVPAGSIAVFSWLSFHRSGFNTTNKMRRVYLAQYGSGMAKLEDGSVFGHAEPFLQDGQCVATAESTIS